MQGDPFQPLREQMVSRQLAARGIRNEAVLDVMSEVPRHRFVPPQFIESAYADKPLPLGPEQTISQPYIVALMLERLQLRGAERVLEIGTGSGYQTALLARLGNEVFSVELDSTLASKARSILDELGVKNVKIRCGDGREGWAEFSPYDAVIVSAASATIPRTLIHQLATGGRMVMPVGDESQSLVQIEKSASGLSIREMESVRFVALKG